MISPAMASFIAKNEKSKIIEGMLLTPEGNEVLNKNDFDRSDRVKYRFSDGAVIILLRKDLQSAPEFSPQWGIS